MNPIIMSTPRVKRGDYSVVPYQSTHNTGSTMTGTDPKSSVVNRYLQAWDADNVFVMGASYNPTRVGGAPAYWSAHAITTQYLKNPGRWCRHEADLRGDLNDPQGQVPAIGCRFPGA